MSDLLAQLQASLGDEYALERELAATRVARVFIARERVFNRAILIKVVKAEQASGSNFERFETEVERAAAINHPNIVPPLMIGAAGGLPYIITPYIPGVTLRERMLEQPPMSLEEVVATLRTLAESLHIAHSQQLYHHDITPDTVLLSQRAALVTDLGTVRALRLSRTEPGAFLGDASYLAPEQLTADGGPDQRADIFAWGCLAYEMLTGMAPFMRTVSNGTVADTSLEEPAPITLVRRDVPTPLVRLIMRAMSADPANRPASADNVMQVLQTVDVSERALAERALTPAYVPAVHAQPSTTSKTTRSVAVVAPAHRNKRRVAAVAATAVLLIATTVAIVMYTPAPPEEPPIAAPPVAVVQRSIAVLPIVSAGDADLGAGLAAELAQQLAHSGVLVSGTASAASLTAKGREPRAVARRLGVAFLLAGTMQRNGNQVQLALTLRSGVDGSVRWTATYDRPLADLFIVEDAVTRAVTAKVQGTVELPAPVTIRPGTSDADAHVLVLQANAFADRGTTAATLEAVTRYQAAIARDSMYARAHAALALASASLVESQTSAASGLVSRAVHAANRAIALDSTIAESHTALAWIDAIEGRNREAEKRFQRSIALDSTIATTWGWFGVLATHVGDYATAHARIHRARTLEPESARARAWDAQAFLGEGKLDRAEQASRPIAQLDSTVSAAFLTHAEALIAAERDSAAIALLEPRVAAYGHEGADAESNALLAYAYAVNGQAQRARDIMLAMRDASGGALPPRATLAITLAALGDMDSAIGVLGKAIERHDPLLLTFNHARPFESLRKDPRGAALFASIERW
jgi:serine/threonine-protein kinase